MFSKRSLRRTGLSHRNVEMRGTKTLTGKIMAQGDTYKLHGSFRRLKGYLQRLQADGMQDMEITRHRCTYALSHWALQTNPADLHPFVIIYHGQRNGARRLVYVGLFRQPWPGVHVHVHVHSSACIKERYATSHLRGHYN